MEYTFMITISTRIPETLDKALSVLAQAADRKKAYLLRRALEDYVKKRGKEDPFRAASKKKLVEIWDNDEDAVYDNL